MNNKELIDFIKINKCNFTKLLRTYHIDLYTEIDTKYVGAEFSEKLFRHLHQDNKTGKCAMCKKYNLEFDKIPS